MKTGFRQSMAWLHTWTGLLFGWLLFAIFLTGTIAYFRNEVTHWMQPELHQAGTATRAEAAELGLDRLRDLAPAAESWQIALPDARSRTLDLSWRMPGETGRRRGGGHGVVLDPSSGAELTPRETAGGSFLYRFHFELYGLPRSWARWIVGIATMSMFVAIISGVITHKKIFKEFFTFRPRKGQRSWLDMHNMTAVLALPFHVMITYSGLLLFMGTLMPFVFDGGDRRGPPRQEPAAIEAPAPPATLPVLTGIAPLLARAEAHWSMPAGRISVEDLQGPAPEIVLAPQRNARLTAHSGSGSNGVERMRFDAVTGDLIEATEGRDLSAVGAFNNSLGSLHRARFAETGLRWLFFFAGLAGTVMVGTGLTLWVSKRAAKHAKSGVRPLGLRLVEGLNVGAIAGLLLAVGAYFWANRLIPAAMEGRADGEIAAFFTAWAAALVHAFLRGPRLAWRETLWAAAALLLTLPLLNPATGGGHLPGAILRGDWLAAGVDLAALVGGMACAIAARSARGAQGSATRSGSVRASARPVAGE